MTGLLWLLRHFYFLEEFRFAEKVGVYKELFFPKEDYTDPTKGYSIQHLPSFSERNFFFSNAYVARFNTFYVSKESSKRRIYLTCSGICKLTVKKYLCTNRLDNAFQVENEPYERYGSKYEKVCDGGLNPQRFIELAVCTRIHIHIRIRICIQHVRILTLANVGY